jgi:ubiquinone/menaquinone biosynthesis C-methylase UbiE
MRRLAKGRGTGEHAPMPTRETYTHGHAESVLRSHAARTVDNSAAYLVPYLRPGLNLLDVGCGPGTITTGFATIVAPGRVLGLDADGSVIAAAVAKAPADGAVSFAVGDAYALELADGSFDIVHAHQLLQHLADPVAALREWRRVCRSGGIVAARDGDYAAFTWHPRDPLLDRWLELYRAAARANHGEPDAGRWLLAWAHAAGFEEVVASASVWCYADPESRAFWGGMWADRILTSALTQQLLDTGIERSELEAIAGAFRRWAAHPDGWFMVPHGEIVCRVP